MQRFDVPETSPWRLKLSVSEDLRGYRYAKAGINAFLSELIHDRRFENPFRMRMAYMGLPRETESEAVYVNHTNEAVALP
jgi:hypothetical protein